MSDQTSFHERVDVGPGRGSRSSEKQKKVVAVCVGGLRSRCQRSRAGMLFCLVPHSCMGGAASVWRHKTATGRTAISDLGQHQLQASSQTQVHAVFGALFADMRKHPVKCCLCDFEAPGMCYIVNGLGLVRRNWCHALGLPGLVDCSHQSHWPLWQCFGRAVMLWCAHEVHTDRAAGISLAGW